MANSADPDQLASSVCKSRTYPGSAGLGLRLKKCIVLPVDVSKILLDE